MFSAVYSSLSSSMPYPSETRSLYFCSNLSEMYFRKISPRTTCLYSEASILPLNRSAAFQICFSNPTSAELTLAIMIFNELFTCYHVGDTLHFLTNLVKLRIRYTILCQIMSLILYFCQHSVTNHLEIITKHQSKRFSINNLAWQ